MTSSISTADKPWKSRSNPPLIQAVLINEKISVHLNGFYRRSHCKSQLCLPRFLYSTYILLELCLFWWFKFYTSHQTTYYWRQKNHVGHYIKDRSFLCNFVAVFIRMHLVHEMQADIIDARCKRVTTVMLFRLCFKQRQYLKCTIFWLRHYASALSRRWCILKNQPTTENGDDNNADGIKNHSCQYWMFKGTFKEIKLLETLIFESTFGDKWLFGEGELVCFGGSKMRWLFYMDCKHVLGNVLWIFFFF